MPDLEVFGRYEQIPTLNYRYKRTFTTLMTPDVRPLTLRFYQFGFKLIFESTKAAIERVLFLGEWWILKDLGDALIS